MSTTNPVELVDRIYKKYRIMHYAAATAAAAAQGEETNNRQNQQQQQQPKQRERSRKRAELGINVDGSLDHTYPATAPPYRLSFFCDCQDACHCRPVCIVSPNEQCICKVAPDFFAEKSCEYLAVAATAAVNVKDKDKNKKKRADSLAPDEGDAAAAADGSDGDDDGSLFLNASAEMAQLVRAVERANMASSSLSSLPSSTSTDSSLESGLSGAGMHVSPSASASVQRFWMPSAEEIAGLTPKPLRVARKRESWVRRLVKGCYV
ncbi:hypothetical protein LTS18_014687 [Coniosporium uncinatum]|uniref:Uncharacterized protein n=1 Tax=Coniosporium uncinatum TaxID=93489 RepID=A0ACC3CVH9_9PEZI|nr:hypothetical protein LTS18_014687 [Coniosporium uncinatum]